MMANAETPVTRIAMLIYPVFTMLDLIGPHQVLSSLPNTEVDLVAKSRSPVVSDRGVSINPDKSFEECDRNYDLILVPGGSSTHLTMEDADTVAFVAELGKNAKYVTSVCTGSLILAAAGLLKGYRATSHWAFRDLLPHFGAIPENERVVTDRNRMTGGGVTAGIDFGFQLAAILRDENVAKMLELLFEYDPAPQFNVGTPERADAETMARVNERLTPYRNAMRATAERLALRP
jgi:cyclohexyl-isocyanide hydratase